MDIESDESERWEDFFGSSTDLTPSLITFYDKLTCNHFKGNSADTAAVDVDHKHQTESVTATDGNVNNDGTLGGDSERIRLVEKEINVITNSTVQSVNSSNHSNNCSNSNTNHSNTNGLTSKHCNFRILSPNVQRLISNSNSTAVDRIENGHVQYHSLNNLNNNSVLTTTTTTKSNKRLVAKQKLSHIPLSKNTCKLTQAGTELVETFDCSSSLSSSESLDALQTPTNKASIIEIAAGDNDKTPTNSNTKSFRFDNAAVETSSPPSLEPIISGSKHLSAKPKPDNDLANQIIEDIHQAEANRISAIIERFHKMYTSTLADKEENLKDTMAPILENSVRELQGTNGKITYETYNFFVRKPRGNPVDSANNHVDGDSKKPPDSPLTIHKKFTPPSSPLLTYSRTKKLGGSFKGNRRHSPSSVANSVDTLSELKSPSPNSNRSLSSFMDMSKSKHRPLSSSSICSTSSSSSSGSEHNHNGKAAVSYLASVESLADNSENENSEKGSTLTILNRACMEIIDSERSYVKDLFQIIDGYLIQWKNDASLKDDDLETLFSNIKDIHSFNADLLDQLIEAGLDPAKIAKCFIDLKDRFDVYTTYCTSYPEAIELLTKLIKATHTHTLLTLTQKSLNHTLPLGSYLLKPVQRILKYHLLLANLRKHCDKEEVAHAHAMMREVARHIDQVKKKLEQKGRVKELENILDGWLGPDLTVLGELKQEGILMENNKPRHVFLFQTMFVITKPKEDDRLQFKQYIVRNNLMLREHLPCEPTSFNVIPYDDPRNQIKLTAKNRDQKREWTQNIKDVMLEQFDIPSRAKELVYKLGDEEDRTPDKNIWKWGSNSTTPVYLERRNQYRRSEMRNRSKMKRKTMTNSTSLEGFSGQTKEFNNFNRNQTMDDNMMPSVSKVSDNSFPLAGNGSVQKLKPGRCNHNSNVCRCSLIRQEFENLADANKERSRSVPRIPGSIESDDETRQSTESIGGRKTSESSALYKFSTLGRTKSAKQGDVKVYTTKSIPKRIATIRKNKSRKETSKFYMDLSDFDDTSTVLKITESTENIQAGEKKSKDSEKKLSEESQRGPTNPIEEEKSERAATTDKLRKDAEIISELLKASLSRVAKKPPKKRSFDNGSMTLSASEFGHNDDADNVPPPPPSRSPPPLDLDDNNEKKDYDEEHIYESLRRNVHVPYKFSPVLNRSKSQQYYSSITKVEKKSRSLPRPESDYVTLVYSESGNLQNVAADSHPPITTGHEILRNSDSNINYESMTEKGQLSPSATSTQSFSSIGDLQAQEAISTKASKNLLQRFISVKGGVHHVSTSENSLLPRKNKAAAETAALTRGNKPPERRVSDVTEMCRQSIIHRQGSDAVGERMANVDYVDPRTLFKTPVNSSAASVDPQRDSVFSLTSSNDSVSETKKNSPIIEEIMPPVTSGETYFDYEENVEACLENDFRDSAVYSDDNDRRQDYDNSDGFSDFQLSPPPISKKHNSEDSGERTGKRGIPPPIPLKPQFVAAPKRLSSVISGDLKSPEITSPSGPDGKSWVLKQIENFNK